MAIIEVNDLRKYYRLSRGLDSASLSVNEGEIFGFIGPNGAGKTTLIRILMGLIEKDSGDAKIFNQSCQMDQKHLNKDIGYLPSEANFFSEYKVSEVIKFYGSFRVLDQVYLERLIRDLDIDVNKKVAELSFGNKKKLGILVALMHQPKLLILDEPTTGLDPLIQKNFLDILLNAKKQGTTIFLSSHVLSDIQKICDRVGLIKDGRVILVNDIDTLKKQEHKVVSYSPNIKLDLKGIENETAYNGGTSFSYKGDINKLLDVLSKHQLKDLMIRDVSLEEIFLSFYESGEKNV